MLRRRWVFLDGLVVVVFLVFVLVPTKSSFPPLPDPNGYDVLVQAAAKVIWNNKSLKERTTNELTALVTTNKAALLELRRGLELPCAVPVMMNEQWTATQITNMMNLKSAAWAMDAEIFHRQKEGDLAGAVDESYDLLRYGRAISRYGVWINVLVGSACEVIAVRRMTNLLSSLNAEQCKRAASHLERHELQRESFNEITGREKEWQRKSSSLIARLQEDFKKHILRQKPLEIMSVPDIEKEYQARALEIRRLMLAVASRAFELERKRKPQSASELVPVYLQTLPVDSTSGAALGLP